MSHLFLSSLVHTLSIFFLYLTVSQPFLSLNLFYQIPAFPHRVGAFFPVSVVLTLSQPFPLEVTVCLEHNQLHFKEVMLYLIL